LSLPFAEKKNNRLQSSFSSPDLRNGTMMNLNRSESMAYPKTGCLAKINFILRQNTKAVVATLSFVCFVLILTLDVVQHGSTASGGAGGLRAL
jgi:hypothetical protein